MKNPLMGVKSEHTYPCVYGLADWKFYTVQMIKDNGILYNVPPNFAQ